MRLKSQKAFTLAEVLVTLAVVGIVASMTVPSLLVSQSEKEISTKVKKAYSTLSQATNLMQAEGKEWDHSIVGDTARHNAALNAYSNYFKYVKTGTTGDLMPNSGVYKFYGTDTTKTFSSTIPAAYLNNGMFFRIYSRPDCSDFETPITDICAFLFVDVNGEKGPNTMGIDLVRFFVARQPGGGLTVVPSGALVNEGEEDYCTPGDTSDEDESLNCTVFYILDKELPQ